MKYSKKNVMNFNPRAPCGARLDKGALLGDEHDFNPRAPCGARPFKIINCVFSLTFQSTRPVWGATGTGYGKAKCRRAISIHAPRVGRDPPGCTPRIVYSYFNPRAPCGARLFTGCSRLP